MVRCPNCGAKAWSEKDKQCDACGYKITESKKLTDAELIYCKTCGCHYLSEDGRCRQHGHGDFIVKVNLKTGVKL